MSILYELIRPDLRGFMPYRSARDEAKKGNVWLNANESPYAFSIDGDVEMNRYPDKQPVKILKIMADLYAVNQSEIVLSRGSDEAIDLLIRLFCVASQDAVMTCTPTYGMYSVSARIQGANVIEVPLLKEHGYQIDVASVLAKWNQTVKVLFLCSPNNPTGNLLNKEDIFNLCHKLANKCIVVVDEAYIDFANTESLSGYINQFPNLVILRTLSKAYGMAGVRFGFLVAHAELVQWVLKIMAPYPLSSVVTEIVAKALSLDRINQVKLQIQLIQAEKMRLYYALQAMPFVRDVMPSAANFVFVKVINAKKIMAYCAVNGMILRAFFDKRGLDDHIRITVGTPDENNQLIELLLSYDRTIKKVKLI